MTPFSTVCPEIVGLGGGAPPAYTAASCVFDGTTNRINFAGVSMSGTGKVFSCSLWFKPDTIASRVLMQGRNGIAGGAQWRINMSNVFQWIFTNPANTTVVFGYSDAVLAIGNWYHCLLSIDTSSASKRPVWINGADCTNNWTTYTIDGILATDRDNLYVGADDGSGSKLDGDLAEVWADDTYVDWSVPANRLKFADAAGDPVDLGSNGSTPFGYAPDIYLRFLPGALNVNSGTDVSTGTVSGTLVSGSTTVGY